MTNLPGVGVFGSSQTAKWICATLQDQGFKVEAVWSRTFNEAEDAASELNIPFYTNRVDDVLLRKDVGLVVISTPPNLHSQIAVKALGIGKHVLCGVPGGLNQSECLRMVQAGQYYPSLMAYLGYSLRFHPGVRLMKEMISEGYVGENINLVDIKVACGSLLDSDYSWLCDSNMGGGVVSLLASHMIDLLTFLQLGKIQRVHANLTTMTKATDNIKGKLKLLDQLFKIFRQYSVLGIRSITAEDFAIIQLYLTGGCFVSICINSILSGYSQDITICGSAGYLSLNNDTLKGKKNGADKDQVFHLDDSYPEAQLEKSALPVPHSKGMLNMIKELREVFQSRAGSSGATFGDGLYVQAVIEAIRRSNECRQWRKLEIIDEDGSGTIHL